MNVAQSFRLPFTLPSFNDMEAAARRVFRRRDRRITNGYAEMKAELQPQIVNAIRKAKLQPVRPGVVVAFVWLERDRRRDPLDVRPACKFVLDALCGADRATDTQARAGVIHCDGWHCVRGVVDDFMVAEGAPGVLVTVTGNLVEPRRPPSSWPASLPRVVP